MSGEEMYALRAELFLKEYKKVKVHNLCRLLFSLHINIWCCDCFYCFHAYWGSSYTSCEEMYALGAELFLKEYNKKKNKKNK